ncbi:tRNA (guanosine(46)-N7)-methyltransferase TrmB [Sphingobacteriaceae bacterium]|nr:tRNA (guanosine(46)-N7)-methyltransferase TrmB [Sphingobacteriaceae bacterium]
MPSKQEKFADFETFKNCFTLFYENLQKGFDLKGKWRSEYFKNDHPIILELGCGKGEYTVGLAKNNPGRNYIGVDIKGNRIWTGASQALAENMHNVGFLRTRIDFIDYCFAENEVDEIWITFPDPQPQSTRARARLTHNLFTERYKKILKKDGIVHLKTDSTSFYEYTLEVIEENRFPLIWHTNDLYKNCPADREELIKIKTYYEKMFTDKGEDIKYIQFKLN